MAGATAAPPATPPGLPRCTTPLIPTRAATAGVGEQLEYDVELLGLDLGRVTIETSRRGTFNGQPVTEYRAWVEGEQVARRLLGVDGQLAALVPDGSFTPVQSLMRYSYRSERYSELQTYAADGSITATRTRNGKSKTFSRSFGAPVLDMLTAFNLMRRLPDGAEGCAVMFTDGRAYTVWLEHVAMDTVELDGREVPATRYRARYGSDKEKRIYLLDLWLSPEHHVLYRAESHAKLAPVFSLVRQRAG